MIMQKAKFKWTEILELQYINLLDAAKQGKEPTRDGNCTGFEFNEITGYIEADEEA
jgi:hypothetical protein